MSQSRLGIQAPACVSEQAGLSEHRVPHIPSRLVVHWAAQLQASFLEDLTGQRVDRFDVDTTLQLVVTQLLQPTPEIQGEIGVVGGEEHRAGVAGGQPVEEMAYAVQRDDRLAVPGPPVSFKGSLEARGLVTIPPFTEGTLDKSDRGAGGQRRAGRVGNERCYQALRQYLSLRHGPERRARRRSVARTRKPMRRTSRTG